MAEHIRLRAPRNHGETLQLPSLRESNALVEANRILVSDYPQDLQSIRSVARGELAAMALRYSKQYSDVDVEIHDRVVMSGHQPTLFHPGVWFKNFALDAAANSADATAINLVVDNDLCDDVSVLYPWKDNDTARALRIPFDSPDVALPFEMRKIKDRNVFDSFADRLSDSISDVVGNPLVNSLWPEVRLAANQLCLPASIAAGRHRLEQKHGLRTLELPVSVMSTSESFAMFVQRLAIEAQRFVESYNDCLQAYRKVNRIRSRSHPVPELEDDGKFSELPFWVWTADDPNRRRLFVSQCDGKIELADRAGWSVQIGLNDFVGSFQELNQLDSSVFIRPRALATTMFSRVFASDLFLHGIGGAKYDQLNDQIIRQFFEIAPPRYMTVTATMKLPIEFEPVTTESITSLRVRLRQLQFHPELAYEYDEDANRKRWLIENVPPGSRKPWRDEIASINQRLFDRLDKKNELEDRIARAKNALPASKVLGSREFSFALFPETLVEELRVLSTQY